MERKQLNSGEFTIEEMLLSKTDKAGVIQFANDIFARVSGYAEAQLLSRPHNIVRHPDMPKTVFKVFWDRLKENKPVMAFVKNRTAGGQAYWVFATAFPTPDGYFSIRIKPTSELLDTVEEIYALVKTRENERALDAGVHFLLSQLQPLGFNNYEEFMLAALNSEVTAREQYLIENRKLLHLRSATNHWERTYDQMRQEALLTSEELAMARQRVARFNGSRDVCQRAAESVTEICEKLEFLAVNMSIAAFKLGKFGGSLAVVASTAQFTSQKIVKSFESFNTKSKGVFAELTEALLNLSCSKVQADMLSYHLTEVVVHFRDKTQPPGRIDEQTGQLLKSMKSLVSANIQAQRGFFQLLSELRRELKDVQEYAARLDLINTGGKLEGSRNDQIEGTFKTLIQEMNLHVRSLHEPLHEIATTIENLVEAFGGVVVEAGKIDRSIEELSSLHSSLWTEEKVAV